MKAIETISLSHGMVAEIHHDQDCENPFSCDAGLKIVMLHKRYMDPAEGECGTTPDEVSAWCIENLDNWFVAPLWMFDHSGLTFRVGEPGGGNPFGTGMYAHFDSGRVGIIALHRDHWGRDKSDAEMLATAGDIAQTYGAWSNGDCYGYVLLDSDGDDLDSCWGYVGMDAVKEEIKSIEAFYGDLAQKKADALAKAGARALEATRPDMYEAGATA